MAIMYITEYARLAKDSAGRQTLTPLEPAIATQYISFTGTAGQSAALNADTAFVCVHVDTNANVLFGTNPTAVDGQSPRLAAGVDKYFGVKPGSSLKISAVTASA